jgi:thymidine kinase
MNIYRMSTSQNITSYLELIIGPMFSGKTSKLLEIYKQCIFCDIKVVVINYAEDVRYHEEMLSTHDKIMIPCIQLTNLMDNINIDIDIIKKNNIECFKKLKTISEADVILINEGQFFGDLKEFVIEMLEKNKKIYVSGLDGDFKREKFGQILDLIPLCDKVTKLSSLCSICKNGTAGIFSLRLSEEEQQKVIGSDNYIPVCRKCYNNKTK